MLWRRVCFPLREAGSQIGDPNVHFNGRTEAKFASRFVYTAITVAHVSRVEISSHHRQWHLATQCITDSKRDFGSKFDEAGLLSGSNVEAIYAFPRTV
jgi:hypothetical protein